MQRFNLFNGVFRLTGKDIEKTEYNEAISAILLPDLHGPFVAGGALRRTILGQPLDSDIDYFFTSREQYEKCFKEVMDNQNLEKTDVKEGKFNTSFKVKFLDESGKNREYLVQFIIHQFYRNCEELIDSFDFTICQIADDGSNIYFGDLTLWDLARKRLVVNRITFGVASLRRLIKYVKQGFYACDGTLKEILTQGAAVVNIDGQISSID